MIYWIALAFAIIFEVAGTVSLKFAALHGSLWYGLLTFLFYLLTFTLLWYAIKKLDLSLAYAIWAGAGTALISIGGIYIFNEQITITKALFLAMIIIGVVGLKLSDGAGAV
ncbi:MAG: DMT family transporter [Campylobacterota bacterium]